eukprot:TRINITY_DN13429_c0_g1_i2.p1 TRINITY_DN13429_c0_g1~~TRINITY_DN13429_c0_g1_i2.p1  ORF type:complete len:218 (-),score=32.71 TRINITY_DN13429_c0_g1_i2:130-783(-)
MADSDVFTEGGEEKVEEKEKESPAPTSDTTIESESGEKIKRFKQKGQLQALKDVSKLDEFLHYVADRLCGRDVSSSDFGSGMEQLIDAVEEFLITAVGQDLKTEELVQELKEVVSAEKTVKTLLTVVAARREEITKQLKNKHVSLAPVSLKDFDWSLRMTLSSDKLSTLREPLLLLTLSLQDSGAGKNINLELSKAELENVLKSLEEAYKTVATLSV